MIGSGQGARRRPRTPVADHPHGGPVDGTGSSAHDGGMAEVEIAGVGQEQGSEDPVLLLREQGGARRYLAIWIGAPEATALAAAEVAATLPRPLTHRLLLDAVEAFGARLVRVRLTELVEGQFHAELDITTSDGGTRAVSARASDAVTLAVHQGCPIEVVRGGPRRGRPARERGGDGRRHRGRARRGGPDPRRGLP